MTDDFSGTKTEARRLARARRDSMASADAQRAAAAVRDRLPGAVPIASDAVVAGYWPIGSELDVRPLLRHLVDEGRDCVLPVVIGRDLPLDFRIWTPSTELVAGAFGVMTPSASSARRVPTVILVPLLAFDARGHRLGYGAGFYDRTLASLRRDGAPVTAVGVGYAVQEIGRVPNDELDEPLDWIVTETSVLKIDKL